MSSSVPGSPEPHGASSLQERKRLLIGGRARSAGRADRRALHMIMHKLSEKRERGREILLQHPGPHRACLPSMLAG